MERGQPALAALPREMQDRLLEHQFIARRHSFEVSWPGAADLILSHQGMKIGRLMGVYEELSAHLVDLAILPSHQGQGHGSAVLRAVCAEAGARGGQVSLRALAGGRAEALYRRLGFVATGGDAPHVEMTWCAA